jgi:serine/threonine protein kinase
MGRRTQEISKLQLEILEKQYSSLWRKCEILEKLADGGMGSLFKVRHRLLDTILVVKLMPESLTGDTKLRRRFIREARTSTKLDHKNLIKVSDCLEEEEGYVSIVMDYIDGLTLEDAVKQLGILPLAVTIEIACQALAAIAYLHRHGVVHRDISPDNFMVTTDDEDKLRTVLIDLGIAKVLRDRPLTAPGEFYGKLRYSSPESLVAAKLDQIDFRSDLYSFAVVLYELLTGESPLPATDSTESLVHAHLNAAARSFDVTDPEGRVPAALRKTALKSMNKRPELRHASADAMLLEIESLRINHPIKSEHYELIARFRANPEQIQESNGTTPRHRLIANPSTASPAPPLPGLLVSESNESEKDPFHTDAIDSDQIRTRRNIRTEQNELLQSEAEEKLRRQQCDQVDQLRISAAQDLIARRFERAVSKLEQADSVIPADLKTIELLAEALAAVDNQRTKESLSREAAAFMKDHRFQEAIARFEKAIAIEPDPETLAELGKARLALSRQQVITGMIEESRALTRWERFEQAVQILKEVLEIDPTNATATTALEDTRAALTRQQQVTRLCAEAAEEEGRRHFDAAVAKLEEALALDPQFTTALENIGIVRKAHGRQKQVEKLRAEARRCIEICRLDEAASKLELALKTEPGRELIAELEQTRNALAVQQAVAELLDTAQEEMSKQQPVTAVARLEQARALAPGDASVIAALEQARSSFRQQWPQLDSKDWAKASSDHRDAAGVVTAELEVEPAAESADTNAAEPQPKGPAGRCRAPPR